MIGIYVLLLLAMLLIVKFCKNKIKFILGAIIIIISIYCVILNIDMNRVKTLRTPIFAKENGYMGSMVRYDGLGYKVGLEKDEYSNITAGQLTILDWYLVQVESEIDYDKEAITNESIEINCFGFDNNEKIIVTDVEDINKIENILTGYKYDEEPCAGIFTHTIKINNEIYNILESCKEINYKGKQSRIKDEDLKYIIEITKKYSNNSPLNDYELSFYPRDNSEITEILELEDYSVKTFGGDVNIIVEGDMVYPLKDALEQNIVTADQILDKAKRDADDGSIKSDMYKDGGSTEYYYDDYTILKMNTLDGDKDLIIGKKGAILTDYNKNNMIIDNKEKAEFTCEIIEVEKNSIIVKPDENCIEAKNNDKIIINTSNLKSEFLVGDKLKITYNGIILTTYPAQIYADKIEYVK